MINSWETFLQSTACEPDPLLKSRVWSAVEKTYSQSFRIFSLRFKHFFVGSTAALCFGLVITPYLITRQQSQAQLQSLDADLNLIGQAISNDSVITEALLLEP